MKEVIHDSDILGNQMGLEVSRLLWPIPVTDPEYHTRQMIGVRIIHDVGFGALTALMTFAKTESWPITIVAGVTGGLATEVLQPILWPLAGKMTQKQEK